MKNGFKIFDTDTHIRPSIETLEPYFDAGARARLPELEPYKRENKPDVEGMVVGRHSYALGDRIAYSRVLGRAEPHFECRFPNSVDYFFGWTLDDELRRKLFWENPVRFYGEP